ncbi:threonine--tRNA ligase [Candidatus Woesearchaeota archaeon]|nr:threonine--tRNA ligase [Candidatus Woesearchaeota archaeon]
MVIVTFPDGSTKEYKDRVTAKQIAEEISEGLARVAVAAKIDDEVVDLSTPIVKDVKLQILTPKDPEGMDVFRHSTAHLMAHAITELYPYARLTIGPVVEEGFYYDMEHEPFKPEDLKKIEEKMRDLVKQKVPLERKMVTKQEALEIFKDNEFKIEMINELEEGTISVYREGSFVDLCRGPHVPHTGLIKAFKLTKIAGAYWRGDAKNKQLQRIYGISFPTKEELKEWQRLREEAEKRDHRKIGKELDLYSFHQEAPGMPFFHAKGMVIWNELMEYWREEHRKDNYQETKTPIMLSQFLWETSGHWDNYRENMYLSKVDEIDYAIKPMNCPGGMLLYKEKIHSYKEFPIRAGEIGLVHRPELSGVLSGLFRVRCFHQDDAHIFMTEQQIPQEILGVLNLVDRMYKTFGLEYHLELSTRPEKSIGTDRAWEVSTAALKQALDETGREYQINEGDGAFYGPKIDIHIKDALGRTWQCGTIQLDMNLPERFDLTYEGEDGKKHRPVMIHRVIYGAMERFIGILVEHYSGKFPLWLAPVQVRVLTVADRHDEFAEHLRLKMSEAGIRVEVDKRAESIPKKVREAQLQKVNYILVVGDKEQENGTVNVRTRDNVVHGEKNPDDFLNELLEEIKEKRL